MTHFTDIDNAYRKITARANMLYEFVILYHNYIYGNTPMRLKIAI